MLLVSIDTLRADHVGCYGHGRPTTPALDRFAAERAARFAHAFGTPNWCEPGFAQCFHHRVNNCLLTFGDFPVCDYTGATPPAW